MVGFFVKLVVQELMYALICGIHVLHKSFLISSKENYWKYQTYNGWIQITGIKVKIIALSSLS